MAKDQAKLLIQLLKKIPIFDELPPTQVRLLLSLCENRKLGEGEILCESGTPSDEMYILLTGQLSVITAEGLNVATILPATTVGEMGVVTGERVRPRWKRPNPAIFWQSTKLSSTNCSAKTAASPAASTAT